jgi:hypothetical protein|tara:strand:+ start:232 stop:510 length:279 start_codon:yes stop_codon:yes gene_type:complete
MIKLKDIITEAPEQETKKFIKTLKSIQSSLNVLIRDLDLYRKSDRSIGGDYWRVHRAPMNNLDNNFKTLKKIYWKKQGIAQKNWEKDWKSKK